MSDSRRKFLKHTIWGGLLSSLGHAVTYDKVFYRERLLNPSDWKSIREQFLLSKDRIFFNTASLGASPISVIETYDQWSRNLETISETGHGNVKTCRNTISSYFNALLYCFVLQNEYRE